MKVGAAPVLGAGGDTGAFWMKWASRMPGHALMKGTSQEALHCEG